MQWRPEVLDNIIVALLKASRESQMKDSELLEKLNYILKTEIPRSQLLKCLIRLEVRGLIHVRTSERKNGELIIKLLEGKETSE